MKTIKVILGIIIVLTLAFFSIGIFVEETNYKVEVNVNKPLAETFTTFNNSDLMKNWIPELLSFEVVNATPEVVGSNFLLTMKDKGGNKVVMNEKVLEFVANEKITLVLESGDMHKTDRFTFQSDGSVTTIQLEASCKSGSYLLSCVFPLFKGTFKSIDQGYLDNFKAYIE